MAGTTISEGTVISHYRVVSRIGAGGMGEVFKAQDTTLERPVALKILPPEVLKDNDRVRRFVGEAKAASALNHPHIVTIHEIGQSTVDDPGSTEPFKIHYIAMEFIEGTTLRTHIYRETELKKLVDIMSQAADGLAKAHNAGIVHRDLKPDNIMVSTDGYAKIVDFGLAKLTEKKESEEDVEHTQEGMILGTAGYMSPEQVQGKLVDQRSDIFSFGCILYECATQTKPFQSETAIDTMHRIVFGQPEPMGEINPDVPEELARIIGKTLAKDPDERYQSIKEIAVDLRNLNRSWDHQMTVGGYQLSAAPAFPQARRGPAPGGESSGSYSGGFRGPSSGQFRGPASGQFRGPASGQFRGPASGQFRGPASGQITLGDVIEEPVSAVPEELPMPAPIPKYVPILKWTYRSILILIVLVVAWLWYSHPEIGPGLSDGPLDSFPLLEARQEAAGATEVEYQWRSRDDTAVPVRVAAVAAADTTYMKRGAPTMEDLKKEGAIAKLFEEKKIPGLSPISRSVANAVVLEPGSPLNSIRQYTVAFDLERKLPKTRILELYINTIEFNPTLFGVEAAAQHYFGKSAGSLDREQAALLIASIGAPDVNLEDPPSWLVDKEKEILEAMEDV